MKELFRELAVIIHKSGEMDHERSMLSKFEVIDLNEVSLLLNRTGKTKVAPEAITFELFGTDLLLSKDGMLYAAEDEERTDIFLVKDIKTIKIVSSFLKWRLKVIEIASL